MVLFWAPINTPPVYHRLLPIIQDALHRCLTSHLQQILKSRKTTPVTNSLQIFRFICMFTSGVLFVVKSSTSVPITVLTFVHFVHVPLTFHVESLFTFRKSAVPIQQVGVLYELHVYVCVQTIHKCCGVILLLCTSLLTPCSRVLLEKLTGVQLVKKFPAFYSTRR
jgi:presenilin-like A22 family membrane protease